MALIEITSSTTTLAFDRGDIGTVEDIQGNKNMFSIPQVIDGGGGGNIFIVSD